MASVYDEDILYSTLDMIRRSEWTKAKDLLITALKAAQSEGHVEGYDEMAKRLLAKLDETKTLPVPNVENPQTAN